MTSNTQHYPVMLNEVLKYLEPQKGGHYIDGTFGRGGYSAAILGHADCFVEAIDRDPEAVHFASDLEAKHPGHFRIHEGCFGDMDHLVTRDSYDGIVLDIGVSSPQLDQAERGFSFQKDGPLDMRMSKEGLSAAELVNTFEEAEMANIIWKYGEERFSRRIARAIVRHRNEVGEFSRTSELAQVVRSAVPKSKDGIDPATRTFQALRIYVNDELGELERGLAAAEKLLSPGGRLVVVSFHSLEDRIVKNFFVERSCSHTAGSRHLPEVQRSHPQTFIRKDRKAILASSGEIAANPRSRSAKLRWGIRTEQLLKGKN